MKRLLSLILSFILLLTFAAPAFAAGDPNIDHGGGGMGQGTGQNYWIAGMDGVRATIIDAKTRSPVTVPLDLTNQSPGTCLTHFGKVCKLSYNAGTGLSVSVGGYACSHPAQTLPHIIPSASLGASIQAIRSYFTDEQVLRADQAGVRPGDLGDRRALRAQDLSLCEAGAHRHHQPVPGLHHAERPSGLHRGHPDPVPA